MRVPCLALAIGTALLLAACAEEPPTATLIVCKRYMVFFDSDSADLTLQARSTIKEFADDHLRGRGARVDITAHTDRAGSAEYNEKLATRRALAIRLNLIEAGVPADSIKWVSRGEQLLLVQTPDGVAEPQNRRAELVSN